MIVLDSCAACEMVRQTERGLALRSLMFVDEKAVSCELIRAELTSIFRKMVRKKELSEEEAKDCFNDSVDLVDEFYPLEPLETEVLNESIRLDHSAYDVFYFVLARRLGATLFTTDQKLMRLCEKHGVNCVAEVEFDSDGLEESNED